MSNIIVEVTNPETVVDAQVLEVVVEQSGETGPKGDTGAQGPAGADGAQGPQGPAGPAGADSTVPGPQGPKGDTGDTGPAGAPGADGADGISAYQVAVNNGFVGTEAQWLASLVGPTGPQGPQGIQGETGPQGIQGPKGDTGDTGATGATGAGVAAGGTAGQVLTKVDGTDYNTTWSTPTPGGVTSFNTRTGAVTLSSSDVTTALGFTPGVGTVTSVSATAPLSSTGGATPDISISLANTTTDGYLSSTDWNTFNNKANSGANSDITSLSGITGLISTATGLDFNTTTPAAGAVGRLTWNTADATLDLGLDSQVTLQIGQEQLLRIHNNSGGSFTDGQMVYVNGSSGNFPTIALAKADSEVTSKGTIGMVTETIANGAEGFVTILGNVRHINTAGFADGDVLYLSATTAGAYTNVEPVSPNHLVTIGYVVRAHATVGQVFVKVDNGYELDELHDVLITTPTTGQALVYNGSGLWVNGTPGTATNVALSGITAATANNSILNTTYAQQWGFTPNATEYYGLKLKDTTAAAGSGGALLWLEGASASGNYTLFVADESSTEILSVTANGTILGKASNSVSIGHATTGTLDNYMFADSIGIALRGGASELLLNASGQLVVNSATGATGQILTSSSGIATWADPATVLSTSATSAPATPKNGDIWFDTNTGIEYTYIDDGDSSQWVQLGTGNVPTNLSITSLTTTSTVNSGGSIVLPNAAGNGIKLDNDTPAFGWADLIGPINVRGSGATDPAWAVFRTNINAYQFTVNDECWLTFHVPHDYVPGSDMFLHVHWAHNSASVTTGAVTFTAHSTYAKGFNQEAFPATKSITITQNASTVQYQHMVAESQLTSNGGSASLIDSNLIEVDGLILVRLVLTADTISAATDPFVFTADIHYQSTGFISTKNRAPNFYL